MNTNIEHLYEDMTDTLKAHLDIEIALFNQSNEVIKKAIESLIEKGLCKHYPEDYDEEYYCHEVKEFSTDNPIYEDITHVLYRPMDGEVAVVYDNNETDAGLANYISELPVEVVADLASNLYNEVQSI